MPAVERPCTDCGKTLPASPNHFKKRKDGSLDVRCLQCRADKMRGRRKQRRAESLRDIEVGAVNSFLGVATTGGQNIPHSAELLESLMEYFGGTSGFSSLIVKQFFDSPPGGAARTKMLEAIVRLVVKNTDAGGAKKPLGLWSEEELEKELDGRLRALAATMGRGRIVDATPTQAPAGPAAIAVSPKSKRVRRAPAKGASGRARRQADRSAEDVPADAPAG